VEPWLAKLNAGDSQGAWDLFHERYRRLILATIRRLVPDHDDVMDLFSSACQALSADDFARLRRYSERSGERSSAATWLVAVVRNLTVDWLRQRDGRRRLTVPSTLSPLQQEIYAAVCIEGHSHVEAYELIRARSALSLPFPEFLREVRATHLAAPCPDRAPVRRPLRDLPVIEAAQSGPDLVESAESAQRLAGVLASQPADVQLAVNLFVVEGMAAADVARVVGWPNAKAVYNRVSRALAQIRAGLEREGLGPDDLR
jgi:RNA polymerase sigma factor (sigma-70 family)